MRHARRRNDKPPPGGATSKEKRVLVAKFVEHITNVVTSWAGGRVVEGEAGTGESGAWDHKRRVSMVEHPIIEIKAVHHISLPVRDIQRSMEFYSEILGLRQIERPPFDFAGAWYQLGVGQLHLIQHTHPTFRQPTGPDPRDIHFAVRVSDYRRTLEFLLSRGFRTNAQESDPKRMHVIPKPVGGFPQIFIVDPDHHVIEFNTYGLDTVGK
jgi:glyoxylase I family protein